MGDKTQRWSAWNACACVTRLPVTHPYVCCVLFVWRCRWCSVLFNVNKFSFVVHFRGRLNCGWRRTILMYSYLWRNNWFSRFGMYKFDRYKFVWLQRLKQQFWCRHGWRGVVKCVATPAVCAWVDRFYLQWRQCGGQAKCLLSAHWCLPSLQQDGFGLG